MGDLLTGLRRLGGEGPPAALGSGQVTLEGPRRQPGLLELQGNAAALGLGRPGPLLGLLQPLLEVPDLCLQVPDTGQGQRGHTLGGLALGSALLADALDLQLELGHPGEVARRLGTCRGQRGLQVAGEGLGHVALLTNRIGLLTKDLQALLQQLALGAQLGLPGGALIQAGPGIRQCGLEVGYLGVHGGGGIGQGVALGGQGSVAGLQLGGAGEAPGERLLLLAEALEPAALLGPLLVKGGRVSDGLLLSGRERGILCGQPRLLGGCGGQGGLGILDLGAHRSLALGSRGQLGLGVGDLGLKGRDPLLLGGAGCLRILQLELQGPDPLQGPGQDLLGGLALGGAGHLGLGELGLHTGDAIPKLVPLGHHALELLLQGSDPVAHGGSTGRALGRDPSGLGLLGGKHRLELAPAGSRCESAGSGAPQAAVPAKDAHLRLSIDWMWPCSRSFSSVMRAMSRRYLAPMASMRSCSDATSPVMAINCDSSSTFWDSSSPQRPSSDSASARPWACAASRSACAWASCSSTDLSSV